MDDKVKELTKMYDEMLTIHSIWLRLVKDGLVKNHDSVSFAQIASSFIDQKLDPTYEGALTILFPAPRYDNV